MSRVTTWSLVLTLVGFALAIPVVAQESGISAEEMAEATRGMPRDALLISPIPGLTTAWHLAPPKAAIPLGTQMRFLHANHPSVSLTWKGAREIYREERWSMAEVIFDQLGSHTVVVGSVLPNGQVLEERMVLEVIDVDPSTARVLEVEVEREQDQPNRTRRLASSIARLRRVSDDRYRIDDEARLRLRARVEPASFAPLLEWSVAGQTRLEIGPEMVLRPDRPGEHRVVAGPATNGRAVAIETYDVTIVPDPNNERYQAAGEPLLFKAVTEPAGFEREVSWQVSVDDGRAAPEAGQGDSFSFQILDAVEPGRVGWVVQADGETLTNAGPKEIDEGFMSTAIIEVSLDPDDVNCAGGVAVNLTSTGLEPAIVRLASPPYEVNSVVPTEMRQLELGAFAPGMGHVMIALRDDVPSVGKLEVYQAEGGQFVSGASSFDIFLTVTLPDLGFTFDTGAQALVMESGTITELPPVGVEYEPVDPEPIPIYDADGEHQEPSGWLCHSSHTVITQVPPYDPPDQDEDWFESVAQTTVTITPSQLAGGFAGLLGLKADAVPVDADLTSKGLAPSEVLLDPGPYEPGQVIRTEIVRLELGGKTEFGPMVLREREDRRSRGSILVHATDADGELLAGEASFDIFFEVELPELGMTLHTGMDAIHVTAGEITGLPPIGAPYEHDEEDAQELPLYSTSTFFQVGSVLSGNHWPTEEVPCKPHCAVDLDIDSDNNNGVGAPDRSAAEDAIEETPPGKYIGLNDDDDDNNKIRDLAEEPIKPADNEPVPMVLELSPNTPPDKWSLTYPARVQVYNMDVNPPAIIPSGVLFNAPMVPNPKTVKVEGVLPSAALGDVVMVLTYHCVTVDQYGYAQTEILTDTVVATVIKVDLDVDSDNTSANPDYPPQRNNAEDDIEDHDDKPGRYVLVNNDDDDNDNIVDFDDGHNLDNIMSYDDVNPSEDDDVKMVLEVPAPVDLNVATLRFTYSADDPSTAAGGAGRLRVWKKKGAPARDKRKINAGGDYVHTGEVYRATDFGLSGSTRVVDLWLEGIRHSAMTSDRILVELDPDGPGPAVWVHHDAVRVTVVQLEFIDDANSVITKVGEDARLMASNIITDRLTNGAAAGSFPRAAVTFAGPATGDPDNFRAELRGVPAGVTPQIRVQVRSHNDTVRSDVNYPTLPPGVVAGANALRINEQLRLVSNATDDGVVAGRDVTRLVRIDEAATGDRVQAEVTLGATAFEASLPVCRPFGENHNPLIQETAIRSGDINFVTLAGAAHTTGTTINWVNRDWAQICMRFRSAGVTPNQVAVSNALLVSGTATGAGAVTVGIGAANINVAVAVGDNAQAVAQNLAAAIQAQAALTGEAFRHNNDWLALVNRGTAAQPNFTAAPASTAAGIAVTQPPLTYAGVADTLTLLEGAVLGLNYKDNDATTLDFFAINVPTILAVLAAATGYDGLAANLPGWENSIMHNTATLSPAAGNNTHIPGHELGHALFDIGDAGHSGVATNVFSVPVTPEPNVNASKRLIDAQNGEARTDSGPGSAGPELLSQN